MVARMSLIVSSMASTAVRTRVASSGRAISGIAPSSDMPVAYSRWITRSCRSRAIRSLSSKTDSRSDSLRCSASSTATAAWAAKVATISAAAGGRACRPGSRPAVSTPRTFPGAPSGTTTAAPRFSASRAARAVRSSLPKSATLTGSPVAITMPDSDLSIGRTTPIAPSAPMPVAYSITRTRRSSSGSASTTRSAPESSRASSVISMSDSSGAEPESSREVTSPLARSHRHPRRRGERDKHGLVILVELAAAPLLGEIEVAEHLIPDPDRGAKKGAHGRMAGREPKRRRVLGNLRQPQRPGVVNELAENSQSVRPVVDGRDLVLVQANRDELDKPLVLADHTERAVLRVHQADLGIHELLKHDLQVEVTAHRNDSPQQAAHAIASRKHRLQPCLHLGQQVIKPQVRQHGMGVRRIHRRSSADHRHRQPTAAPWYSR